MRKLLINGVLCLVTTFTLISCSKDDVNEPIDPYTVPDTYTFDNVEYQHSAATISMWSGYTGILGRSATRQLSQDTINNLWTNTNSSFTAETANGIPYTYDVLNTLPYNLAGQTSDASTFKSYADSMVNISQYYNTPASQGVAGKIGNRIFNHTGLEFNQVVAKGLMGAMAMSNIIRILDKIEDNDNVTVVAGSGTAMQHNWDLAFGYVGIPKDYDTAVAYTSAIVDRPLCLGGYFAERGKYIQAGGIVFKALCKGRAAIGAKDYAVRDQSADLIKEYIEKTIAAAAYFYATSAQTQADLAAKFHALSEAYGFIEALKYRSSGSPLTASNFTALQEIIHTDFYELAADANNTKLKEAQVIFTNTYGQLQP